MLERAKENPQEEDELPPEVLVLMLSFLNNTSLKQSTAVNHTWNLLIHEHLLLTRAIAYVEHKLKEAGCAHEKWLNFPSNSYSFNKNIKIE